jgi:hypothetical protein
MFNLLNTYIDYCENNQAILMQASHAFYADFNMKLIESITREQSWAGLNK